MNPIRVTDSAFEVSEFFSAPPAEYAGLQPQDSRPEFARRYETYRAPLHFHVSDPANRCHAYAVSPHMIMAVVDVGCTESFESRLYGQDIVEFHYRVSGSILLEGSWGELCVREPSCLVWYQAHGCNDAAERLGIRKEVRETWVSLYCDRNWLYRVAGLEAIALLDGLTQEDGSAHVPRFRTTSRIGEMVPILKEIVRAPQKANADWLMTIARAHELLHVTLGGARRLDGAEPAPDTFSDRDRQRIAHARDILSEEFAAPPALPELARRSAINTSRLCAGFKQLFGETTSEFVRRSRLELAQTLLTQTDLQVREIARRAGYAHHGTFTAAFTRHFGVPPKVARRAGRNTRRGTLKTRSNP